MPFLCLPDRRSIFPLLIGFCLFSVSAHAQTTDPAETPPADNGELAGNDEVARVMREFKGRGDLGDGSQPATPLETLGRLKTPEDVQVELVTAESTIAQPLHIHFDFRGRMWVVQYRQYPFPAGLKVVRYDQHLRAVFDKIPPAPPHHTPGADCVTVFEDTDGDGTYDAHRDVITGLNIATSAAVTPEGIWVMNPPYLLFYPDADQDAVVDGDPEVHLTGFGIEDTHAVANSLRSGPDGWLYGANGSTTTASVRAPLSENPEQATSFQGQCIWRYHPQQHRFEVFAEGGGNTFGMEIDAAGLTFSGTNGGSTRGMFYPQGSYGQKSWGKHGPLTNPYAFGYFPHMRFEGDTRRFTQALVVYQDDAMPERYRDQIVAINPLQRCVISSNLEPDTSTFRTSDFEQTVETDDRWFRPVAIAVGPDGGVYLADWYDTRLTHVDPRDNWHKTSGRVYRLTGKETPAKSKAEFEAILPSRTRFDLLAMETSSLLELLKHPSRTIRFLTLDAIVDRDDQAAFPSANGTQQTLDQQLQAIIEDSADSRRLLALWALERRGALTEATLLERLSASESDPNLRRWAIRILGDRGTANASERSALVRLANEETDVRVRSQLASSAARLPADVALPVIDRMLRKDADQQDLQLPLLIWWALEAHCGSSADSVAAMFKDPDLWQTALVRQTILSRLMRRFAAEGTPEAYEVNGRLLAQAPDMDSKAILIRGFEEAFAGRKVETLPKSLQDQLAIYRKERPESDLPLRLRQGDKEAVALVLKRITDPKVSISEKVELISILGETRDKQAVSGLLRRLTSDPSVAVKQAALQALSRFPDPSIGRTIAGAYHSAMDDSTNLREMAIRVLGSRPEWAAMLLNEIDAAKIAVERVPADVVVQMQSLGSEPLKQRLSQHWGTVRATPAEKQTLIQEIEQIVKSRQAADDGHGQALFTKHCGACHKMFGAGGKVGPDLTGYERSNLDFLTLAVVDPSAAIREEFTNYRLLTVDGQVIGGLLENQTPDTYTIRTAEGQAIQINREDVESLQASPVSLMPENLLAPLSPEEIRDLFAYLQRRGQPSN